MKKINIFKNIKYSIFTLTLIVTGFVFTNPTEAGQYTYGCADGGTVTSNVAISPTGPFSAGSTTPFDVFISSITSTCSSRAITLTAQNNTGTVHTLVNQTFTGTIGPFFDTVNFAAPSSAGTYAVHFITGVDEAAVIYGRIEYWFGKVNQHKSMPSGSWLTDPDGVSGALIDQLVYCQKWWPGTNNVLPSGIEETITTWKREIIYEQSNYTATFPSYNCGYDPAYDPALAPPSVGFSAEQLVINLGDSTNLWWDAYWPGNVTSCNGTGFSTGGAIQGTLAISPVTATTYTISCSNINGTTVRQVTVNIAPPTISLSANPNFVYVGYNSTVSWSTTGATSCTSSDFSTGGAASGSDVVNPSVQPITTYTIDCIGPGGSASEQVSIDVAEECPKNEECQQN